MLLNQPGSIQSYLTNERKLTIKTHLSLHAYKASSYNIKINELSFKMVLNELITSFNAATTNE